jgi:putative membrane protein
MTAGCRGSRLLVAGIAGLLVFGSGMAGAAGGTVNVVVRKTVLITMGPDAKSTSQRVYTQLTATGAGSVQVSDPVGPTPLRNLNGFAAPNVVAGKAVYNLSVSGRADRRTVQDFTGQLPIKIGVAVTLDGNAISPGDVVDKSGLLKVTYTVTNVSGVQQSVQIPDGRGGTLTKQETVPVPIVGTMATTLPASFAAVDAPGAAIGADGHGGSQLSYTLLLFEPIGSSSATLTYQAQLSRGSMPFVEFQFLPIAPEANPSTKSAQDQYKGGQDQGLQLTSGATTIDSNLLKLQAGAGQLLSGLQKLAAGATQLSDGLNGQAVPGSKKLADGLDQAEAGGAKLASGAAALAAGLSLVQSIDTGVGSTASIEAGQPASDLMTACKKAGVALQCSATVARVISQWAADQTLPILGNGAAGCDPASTLLCGANALSGGAAQLLAGLKLLAAGSHILSSGLGAAGSGASQIAAGLGLAVPGGSQIHAGAGLLSALGTKKLISAGVSTVGTFGEKYAVMQALNARIAAGDGIPNGPAAGATMTTGAYDFRLAAATKDGTTNLIRLALIVILFAAGLVLTRVLKRD